VLRVILVSIKLPLLCTGTSKIHISVYFVCFYFRGIGSGRGIVKRWGSKWHVYDTSFRHFKKSRGGGTSFSTNFGLEKIVEKA
jgi:hypothetical protein